MEGIPGVVERRGEISNRAVDDETVAKHQRFVFLQGIAVAGGGERGLAPSEFRVLHPVAGVLRILLVLQN